MMNLDAVHLATMVDTLGRAAADFDSRMAELSPYNGEVHDDVMRCHRMLIGMQALLEKHRMKACVQMIRRSDPSELKASGLQPGLRPGRSRLNTIPDSPKAIRESDKPPVSER